MNSPARIGRQSPLAEGAPCPGRRRDRAALDRRLREAVGIAEVLDPVGQRRADVLVDDRQPAVCLHRGANPRVVCVHRLLVLGADHHQRVDVGAAESALPGGRVAVAVVAEQVCAGRHPLAELLREPRQRRVGQLERPHARVAEGDVDARVGLVVPRRRGQHLRRRVGDPGRRARDVVDAQEQVAGERQPVAAHDEPLDARQVERGHCPKRSRKAACSASAPIPCADSAKSITSRRTPRLRLTCSTVRSP